MCKGRTRLRWLREPLRQSFRVGFHRDQIAVTEWKSSFLLTRVAREIRKFYAALASLHFFFNNDLEWTRSTQHEPSTSAQTQYVSTSVATSILRTRETKTHEPSTNPARQHEPSTSACRLPPPYHRLRTKNSTRNPSTTVSLWQTNQYLVHARHKTLNLS